MQLLKLFSTFRLFAKGGLISKIGPIVNKRCQITPLSRKWNNLYTLPREVQIFCSWSDDSDLTTFVANRTKVKIPSDIKPPLVLIKRECSKSKAYLYQTDLWNTIVMRPDISVIPTHSPSLYLLSKRVKYRILLVVLLWIYAKILFKVLHSDFFFFCTIIWVQICKLAWFFKGQGST